MSAAPKDFEIVLDRGTAVVWAADREAWRRGMVREAVFRAQALVGLLRRKQIGSSERVDVVEIILLEQVERILDSAHMLSNPVPFPVTCEEECADDVLGDDRCQGTLSATGRVVAKGVEGDPELRK